MRAHVDKQIQHRAPRGVVKFHRPGEVRFKSHCRVLNVVREKKVALLRRQAFCAQVTSDSDREIRFERIALQEWFSRGVVVGEWPLVFVAAELVFDAGDHRFPVR